MRVLLDTNRYRDFAEGDRHVLGVMRRCDRVFLSSVSLAELRSGFALGGKSMENERNLGLFLQKDSVGVLYPKGQRGQRGCAEVRISRAFESEPRFWTRV